MQTQVLSVHSTISFIVLKRKWRKTEFRRST